MAPRPTEGGPQGSVLRVKRRRRGKGKARPLSPLAAPSPAVICSSAWWPEGSRCACPRDSEAAGL